LQGLGEVRLGWKSSRYDVFRFRFYTSDCIYRRRMRTYQQTAWTDLDTYDVLYGGHKTDAGVGLGSRRRFLDICGFPFSTSYWNIFLIELRDSIVFSVVQTIL
jgi:hypothetical protein